MRDADRQRTIPTVPGRVVAIPGHPALAYPYSTLRGQCGELTGSVLKTEARPQLQAQPGAGQRCGDPQPAVRAG